MLCSATPLCMPSCSNWIAIWPTTPAWPGVRVEGPRLPASTPGGRDVPVSGATARGTPSTVSPCAQRVTRGGPCGGNWNPRRANPSGGATGRLQGVESYFYLVGFTTRFCAAVMAATAFSASSFSVFKSPGNMASEAMRIFREASSRRSAFWVRTRSQL
jgi:hypothetical protein